MEKKADNKYYKKQGEQGPKQSIQFNSLLIFTLRTVSTS